MRGGAVSGRGIGQWRAARLRERHEFGEGFGRRGVRNDQHHREAHDKRNRREIGHRVVAELRIDELVGGEEIAREEERVAVRRRARGCVGRDVAACAALVLDNDLLPPDFGELGTDNARDRVAAAAGRKRNDDADRAIGPSLGARRAAEHCGRQSRCGEREGATAREHDFLPGLVAATLARICQRRNRLRCDETRRRWAQARNALSAEQLRHAEER